MREADAAELAARDPHKLAGATITSVNIYSDNMLIIETDRGQIAAEPSCDRCRLYVSLDGKDLLP